MDPQQLQQPQSVPTGQVSLESFIKNNAGIVQTPPQQPQFQQAALKEEESTPKAPKVHGFFRTLTLIALVAVGFLMLFEALNIYSLSLGNVQLKYIYPLFVIFSCIVIWSYRGIFGKLFGLLLFLAVFGGFFGVNVYTTLTSSQHVSSQSLAIPLSSGVVPTVNFSTLISTIQLQEGQQDNFLSGTYISERSLQTTSDTNSYSFIEDTHWNLLQHYLTTLNLSLSSGEKFLFTSKSLASKDSYDFSSLTLSQASLGGLLTDTTVTLGSQETKLSLEFAAGMIKLRIPKNVGVVLDYGHRAALLSLPNFALKDNHTFVSTNIGSATVIDHIYTRLGVGSFSVEWY